MRTLLAILIGLALGSFANVIIDRVPDGRSIRGRSQCDRCRRKLLWWELVPVVSAIVLHFRCRTCRARIPARLLLVELSGALLVLGVLHAARWIIDAQTVATAIGLTALGILAVIDVRRGIVPDAVSVPAIAIVSALQIVSVDGNPRQLITLAATVAAGAGFFQLQRMFSRGRWVGDGDVRVGALLGATLVEPLSLVVGLSASYIIGGGVALVLLTARRVERGSRIPFVPFLFLGGLIAAFWGTELLAWYGVG